MSVLFIFDLYKKGNERLLKNQKFHEAIEEFEKRISFSPRGGLCSGNLESLKENLTYREMEEVLARFGVSMKLCDKRRGLECKPNAGDSSGVRHCLPSPRDSDFCYPCDCH